MRLVAAATGPRRRLRDGAANVVFERRPLARDPPCASSTIPWPQASGLGGASLGFARTRQWFAIAQEVRSPRALRRRRGPAAAAARQP